MQLCSVTLAPTFSLLYEATVPIDEVDFVTSLHTAPVVFRGVALVPRLLTMRTAQAAAYCLLKALLDCTAATAQRFWWLLSQHVSYSFG